MNDIYTTQAPIIPNIDAVKNILGYVRDIVVTGKIEETKREAIRAQAEIAIAQIEADNSTELKRIQSSHEERMKTIAIVENALKNPNIATSPEIVNCFVSILKATHVGEINEQK